MAQHKKPASAKKPSKPGPVRKTAPVARKAATARPTAAGPAHAATGKSLKSSELKRRLLERKTTKPIAFSLDEVREIAKKNEKKSAKDAGTATSRPAKDAAKAGLPSKGTSRPPIPNHIKAASLADILGFNPNKGKKPAFDAGDATSVPEKYRRYYKLLVDLRNHVLESLGQHAEETLKRSAKEDAGDLSGYGQHMADAGTDTFDRDFALSLVSSEQEALSEVEAAIKRIHDGTYGICELTGKPISRDRLLAVPFTRYSAEAQKELEKTKHRSVQRAGIFADTTTEEGGGKLAEEEPEE
ncbi:MAG: TraR/DksA C4-type zinc finger protein [Opitutaceae bacterium]|nr:TraR/DksA C4-type zinc finger protein [Opitutaceae bacterium]